MPDVGAELGSGTPKERIVFPRLGELDLDAADRLVEGVIDNCALMPAERSDPVARAKEREIALHYLIEQRDQICLYSTLRCGLDVLRVARLKRPSAQDDSGPLIKINGAELGLFQSESSQLSFVQATESKHGAVLVVGGNIISANPEQQERFHVPHPTRLLGSGPCLSRPFD